MEKIFLLLCAIIPGLIVLFCAYKNGLLQKVVIKKFATYRAAMEFLEKITSRRRSAWRRTLDYCNPVTLVETQRVGRFAEIDEKWILTRHKNKPIWLVTNDHFFIEKKLQDNRLCTFIGFVPGCINT